MVVVVVMVFTCHHYKSLHCVFFRKKCKNGLHTDVVMGDDYIYSIVTSLLYVCVRIGVHVAYKKEEL